MERRVLWIVFFSTLFILSISSLIYDSGQLDVEFLIDIFIFITIIAILQNIGVIGLRRG